MARQVALCSPVAQQTAANANPVADPGMAHIIEYKQSPAISFNPKVKKVRDKNKPETYVKVVDVSRERKRETTELLPSGLFSDVELIVPGGKIAAQKAIFATGSSVLKTLLAKKPSAATKTSLQVQLADCDALCMYLYSGAFPKQPTATWDFQKNEHVFSPTVRFSNAKYDVMNLLAIASELKLTHLFQLCQVEAASLTRDLLRNPDYFVMSEEPTAEASSACESKLHSAFRILGIAKSLDAKDLQAPKTVTDKNTIAAFVLVEHEIVPKISSHFGESKVTVVGKTSSERPDDIIERRFLADWYPAFNQYAIDEKTASGDRSGLMKMIFNEEGEFGASWRWACLGSKTKKTCMGTNTAKKII
ncbi:hypothetical protein HDU98_000979 [Podochytrium sp. JEL0797]|nr:hypothetical protein HDU98_000979 [Podochytrium sp. JEL0797]